MNAVKIEFTIAAGKMEWDDDLNDYHSNWKYCDATQDAAEALKMFMSARYYPVCEFHVETTWESGACTRSAMLEVAQLEVLIDGHWEQAESLTKALSMYDEWKKHPDGMMP